MVQKVMGIEGHPSCDWGLAQSSLVYILAIMVHVVLLMLAWGLRTAVAGAHRLCLEPQGK